MKKILFLMVVAIVVTAGSAFGQEWRDSLDHARALYKKGAYSEALKYYKSAERLAPKGVNLSEEKGQSAYRAAKYPEAEKAFEQSIAQQKDTKRRSSAYNNLGNARLKQKNFEGAQEAFKEALRLDPANEKARQNLAEAKRIQKEEEKKKQEQQDQQPKKDPQPNDENNDGQPKPPQKPGDQQPKDAQGKPKPQPGKGDPKTGTEQRKLEDKQTDRKLDDLMRQEMETKKRLDGSKSSTHGKPAKKDW